MARYLRRIRRGNWCPREEPLDWLPAGERPADALGDLKTRECSLSVWQLTDDGSNRERILAAIASTRMSLGPVDYIVFPSEMLEGLGLVVVKCAGDTHDRVANSAWHHDLTRVSDQRLVILGRRLLQWVSEDGTRLSRVIPPNLKLLLIAGIDAGRLAGDKIDERLRKDIGL